MSNLLAARWQMAISLGFHIIFAVIGIALPLMMVVAEAFWLRTGDPVYRYLARSWARGAAILFAVGAVSGTVLSFELGLLWPHFMQFAGPIIGLGFGLEGFAFFTEAIFLGIYIYGWDRVPPLAHWLAGVIVAVSGAASGVLVVAVNAWMNTPAGFRLQGKEAVDVAPMAALLNPSMAAETLHMTLASYAATGFLVAGVHAIYLRRDRTDRFHRAALAIALMVGGAAALLQPISGDYSARVVSRTQPVKLAAMEGQFRTERRAPLRIGGIPDPKAGETRYALEIPGALSLMAHGSLDAEVLGLNDVPAGNRPPVEVVHMAFQVMVGCGTVMMFVALWGGLVALRTRRLPDAPWFLRAVALTSPLGMLAIEAGWTVTEVGRQPWVIHRIMRTSEAVTPVGGLWVSLVSYTALYLVLGVVVVLLLLMQFRRSPGPEETGGLRGGRQVMIISPEYGVVLALLFALMLYALFGGADFGAGVWDLLARGPRAEAQRDLIAHAIGPVWEANHVWLIIVVVLLFTGFPTVFAVIMTDLHVPLSLMLVGIVLRGSAFTFSRYDTTERGRKRWNRVYSLPSVFTPVLLGAVVGAIATGGLTLRPEPHLPLFSTWVRPFPLTVGLFTLAIFSYLAAVYLTLETSDPALQDDFRLRALISAVLVGVLAYAVYLLARRDAPLVFRGLDASRWGLPVRIATGGCAILALTGLWFRWYRSARVAAMLQVALILWGCALAQNPYLIPPRLTVANSAAPPLIHKLLLVALAAGSLILFPSIYYLFRVFKGHTFLSPGKRIEIPSKVYDH